jgi:hypothetical protein
MLKQNFNFVRFLKKEAEDFESSAREISLKQITL